MRADPIARLISGAQATRRHGGRGFGRSVTAARQSNLEFSWNASITSSDEFIKRHHTRLVARSREGTVNYEHLRKFHVSNQANVVGPSGIKTIPRFVDDFGEADKLASKAVKEAWDDWCEKGNCEITGRHSWSAIQGIYMKTIPEDGEFLARIVFDRKYRYGIKLQLLDTQLLPVDMNIDKLPNGNRVALGVELDKFSKPVAYHLRQEKATDTSWSWHGHHHERVPADFIIHEYLLERTGQKRGLPWVTSALARIRMLYGMDEAFQTKLRIGATATAVITAPEGKWKGAGEEDDEGWINREIVPGEYLVVPNGTTIAEWDPKGPGAELPLFRKGMLQTIAVGLTQSYPSVSGDLEGVSFSSIRQGSIEERAIYKGLREGLLIQGLVQRVYRAFLRAGLMLEVFQIPTKKGETAPLSLERERKYWNVLHQGSGWEYVRPLEDTTAWKEAVQSFQASPQDAIRARGGNPDVVLAEWAEFIGQLKEIDEGLLAMFMAPRTTSDTILGALLDGESEGKEPTK